jgi:Ca2+-binding EF-hand superfamily protein
MLQSGREVTLEDVKTIIKEVDLKRDGMIDFDEFCELMGLNILNDESVC